MENREKPRDPEGLGFGDSLNSKMKVKALAFVGIPVADMKRARTFYEGILGLKVSEEMMSGEWVEYSLGNNTLAVACVGSEWLPSDQGTGAALEVDNFDEAITWLKDRHVPFTTEPFESPCCHMAIIQDPDRNNIVIHKLKPENEKQPCL
jgi:predicted enzyme related to lactoylglutathione lyase